MDGKKAFDKIQLSFLTRILRKPIEYFNITRNIYLKMAQITYSNKMRCILKNQEQYKDVSYLQTLNTVLKILVNALRGFPLHMPTNINIETLDKSHYLNMI